MTEIQSQRTASQRTRTTSVRSKSVRSKRSLKAKKPHVQTKLEKQMHIRRSKVNNTTRWLADSSFQTYFGKPAFHPYGRANTNPSVGGICYGNNMLTHNINAECGDNPPAFQ